MLLLPETESSLEDLKNRYFAVFPKDVGHFYYGDFLFIWKTISRIGFSLNTTLYFFSCLLYLSSLLKLLIYAIKDPLGLAMERLDFVGLFLLIFFLKLYLKLEIYHSNTLPHKIP